MTNTGIPFNGQTYVPTLECGHQLTFHAAPPSLGERMWCFRCDKYAEVTDCPYHYYGKCKSCVYKTHGYTKKAVLRSLMTKHQKGHKGHRMILLQNHTVIESWDALSDDLQESFRNLLTDRGLLAEWDSQQNSDRIA